MWRILKLAAALMGLFLLIMTLGGWVVRPNTDNQYVPLLVQDIRGYDFQRLVQIWPGIVKPLYLSDTLLHLRLYGIDEDGKTLYIGAHNNDITRVRYYHIRSSRPSPELLVDAIIDTLVVSPHFTWLLYATQSPVGLWDYQAYNPHTGQRWPISQMITPRTIAMDFNAHHYFSADDQWLYLSVVDSTQPSFEIVAVHLTDGALVEVTAGAAQTDKQGVMSVNGDWLIFAYNDQFFRIRTDGTEIHPLVDIAQIQVNPNYRQYQDRLGGTNRADGIVLFYHANVMVGVEVATGRLLWQQDALVFYPYERTSGPWATLTNLSCCQRLHIPSGGIERTPPNLTLPGTEYVGRAPDDRWIIYTQPNATTGGAEWWQYDWATHTVQLLRTGMDTFSSRGISPDGAWVLVENSITRDWSRVSTRDGHMEPLLTGGTFRPVGWMKPYVRAWQPIRLLMIGGGLLLLGFFPSRLTKLPHRYLSSLQGH